MSVAASGPILLVGAGRMGGALLNGWLAGGLPPRQIFVQEPSPPPDIAAAIAKAGIRTGAPPAMEAPPAVILLAVKPQMMEAVLPGVAAIVGPETVVLSIAAGTSIASIARHFAQPAAIVRAMPNTPAAMAVGIRSPGTTRPATIASAPCRFTQPSTRSSLSRSRWM